MGEKEWKFTNENGTSWFPLRMAAEIFFNDEVMTAEDEMSGGSK